MEYADFELEIGHRVGELYPVAVTRASGGDGREAVSIPYNDQETWRHIKTTQAAKDFGQALFEAIFVGQIRSCFDVSRDRARQQGQGLRLRLRILPLELSVLPWEYLYDQRRGEFFSLSRSTPVVRYLETAEPTDVLKVPPPLRVLALGTSPLGLPQIDIEHERARLSSALSGLIERGLVELNWLPGQTWRDLQRALRNGPWHIFHYIGHGGFDVTTKQGFLAFADAQGELENLHARELARLLEGQDQLRLVLLTACDSALASQDEQFSSTASIVVQESSVPAVVAMQYTVSIEAAAEFSESFYEALAASFPVDAAVTDARKAVSILENGTLDWAAPVLYLRAPTGLLFDLKSQGALETTANNITTSVPSESSATAPGQQDTATVTDTMDGTAPSFETGQPVYWSLSFSELPANPWQLEQFRQLYKMLLRVYLGGLILLVVAYVIGRIDPTLLDAIPLVMKAMGFNGAVMEVAPIVGQSVVLGLLSYFGFTQFNLYNTQRAFATLVGITFLSLGYLAGAAIFVVVTNALIRVVLLLAMSIVFIRLFYAYCNMEYYLKRKAYTDIVLAAALLGIFVFMIGRLVLLAVSGGVL